MSQVHSKKIAERWKTMSFYEQMGNIGSEICRARVWDDKGNFQSRNKALERAIELTGLTALNQSEVCRCREITRLREVLNDILANTEFFRSSLKSLENYCLRFAIIARTRIAKS